MDNSKVRWSVSAICCVTHIVIQEAAKPTASEKMNRPDNSGQLADEVRFKSLYETMAFANIVL